MAKTKQPKRCLSAVLILVLIAVIALMGSACDKKKETGNTEKADSGAVAQKNESVDIGEGKTAFTLTVTGADKKTKTFNVRTDEKTVGAALLKLGLIEGEESQYGLFIKKVDGEEAVYETSGTYWAFYENGAYASAGVDQTDVTAGAEYALKVES